MVFPGTNKWVLMVGWVAYGCTPRGSDPNDRQGTNAPHESAAAPAPTPSADREPIPSAPPVDSQPSPAATSPEPDASLDASTANEEPRHATPAEPAREAAEPASTAPVAQKGPPSLDCASQGASNASEADRELSRWTCERQEEFQAFVFKRQACSQSSDCIRVWTQCPLGCSVSVNAKHTAQVKAKHDALLRQLNARGVNCRYRCRQFGEPTCVEGRCQ